MDAYTTLENNVYYSSINEGMSPVKVGLVNPTEDQIKDLYAPPAPEPEPEPEPQPEPAGKSYSPIAIRLQVGINNDTSSVIEIDTNFALGEFNIDISTEELAHSSLTQIDELLSNVITKKTELASASNRLQSTMEFQQVQRDSKIAMLSVVKDADIAKESSDYIKAQILQQTTASLLAQANQTPSIALRLLSI